MQAEDRALGRSEIAAYFRLFWRADDLDHRLIDRGLLVGFCHLEQAAANDVGRAGQELLQLWRAEIAAVADGERQHAVAAGALDQRRISDRRKLRAGIAGDA